MFHALASSGVASSFSGSLARAPATLSCGDSDAAVIFMAALLAVPLVDPLLGR